MQQQPSQPNAAPKALQNLQSWVSSERLVGKTAAYILRWGNTSVSRRQLHTEFAALCRNSGIPPPAEYAMPADNPDDEAVQLDETAVRAFLVQAGLQLVASFTSTSEPAPAAAGATAVVCPPHLLYRGGRPGVIAHRGLTGTNPEHSILAYTEAFAAGADYIEMDAVCTKDGHVIVRHDLLLDKDTNVKSLERFQGRAQERRVWAVDGDKLLMKGFYACDFTLAEVKEMEATEEFESRKEAADAPQQVLTLQEACALVQKLASEAGRDIGIFIETKRSHFHKQQQLDLEPLIKQAVAASGFQGHVVAQSFEPDSLRWFQRECPTWSRMRLVIDSDTASRIGMDMGYACPPYSSLRADLLPFIAPMKEYATMVGVRKVQLIADDANAPEHHPLADTILEQGLQLVAYTFRADQLPAFYNSPTEEYFAHFRLGVQAVFTDHCIHALDAAKQWQNKAAVAKA